jgi:hypothetical protein
MTDWLREFPLPMKPDSWQLNDIYLRKIEELGILLNEAGYALKLGLELEFALLSPEEAKKKTKGTVDDPLYSRLHPEYQLLEDSRLKALAVFPPPEFYIQTLNDIRDWFSVNPDADDLLKKTKWTHEEAMKHLVEIEDNLHHENPETVHRARQNVFLAYLHTRSFAEGGLADLVEPRFGDHELGLGWYDMVGPEVRTCLLTDPMDIIESYHKFMAVLTREAPHFGLAFDLTTHQPPQFHISVWRKSDNKNMMLMNDPESVQFCERAMCGLYEVLNTMPFMIQDRDWRQEAFSVAFTAGSTRLDFIRQEPDNWEIRRFQSHGVTHAARHLSMLLMGIAYGHFYEAEYQRYRHQQDFYEPKREIHPVVRHRYGAYISGLVAVLEHCRIEEDGSLKANGDVIEIYLERLKEEVGHQSLKDFVVTTDKNKNLEFDLRHHSTWEILLGKIKVNEDNSLDLSILGENSEVAEAFNAVEITGRRTVLKVSSDHLTGDAHSVPATLRSFMQDKMSGIFFTPYERSEIVSHYRKQSLAILKDIADVDVSRFEDFYNHPDNAQATDDDFAAAFRDQIYMTPTAVLDLNASVINIFIHFIKIGAVVDRQRMISNHQTYNVSMRPHFKAAVEHRVQELGENQEKNAKLIQGMKTCLEKVLNKPFKIQEAPWVTIKPVFQTIADGSLISMTGLTENIIESLYMVPLIGVIRAIGLAMQDDTFSNRQIVEEAEELFRTAPSIIESYERELGIQNKDEMTRLLFESGKKGVLHAVSEVRDWACTTMGHGLCNELPAPKETGPEYFPDPSF